MVPISDSFLQLNLLSVVEVVSTDPPKLKNITMRITTPMTAEITPAIEQPIEVCVCFLAFSSSRAALAFKIEK